MKQSQNHTFAGNQTKKCFKSITILYCTKHLTQTIMQLLLYLSLSWTLTYTLPTANDSSLCNFLEKLAQYHTKHKPQYTTNMPIVKPQEPQPEMPSPKIIGFMEDPDTGLQYYPKANRIYDPETGYSFDTKSRKIFKGKTEVETEGCKRK